MNTMYYITEEISNVYMSLYESDPPTNPPAPQDPNAVDPNTAPQDPNAVDPNTAPQDPNAVDPNTAPQDPNAVDPNTAPQDPNAVADGTDPKLDPIKKYILLTKIVELKQYLELYAANTETSNDSRKLIKFIGIIIDFYDIFDYISLKDLSEGIIRESSKIIKHRGNKIGSKPNKEQS